MINITDLMKSYPKKIMEKMNRILLNINKTFWNIEDEIDSTSFKARALFCESDYFYVENEINAIIEFCLELKYVVEIEKISSNQKGYKFTASAFKKMQEILEKRSEINQAFIVMIFDERAESIFKVLAWGDFSKWILPL